MDKIKVKQILLSKLQPYADNPRINERAVDYVAKSIQDYGFKVPLVVDKDLVIICGHTRYEAAKQLGIDKVPCVVAEDLNEEQVAAYRLADNKVAEFSSWDFEKLQEELGKIGNIDMGEFNFFRFDDEEEELEEPDDIGSDTDGPVSKQIVCTCPKCRRQFEL